MLGDVRQVPLDKLVNALYGKPEDRRGQEDLEPSEEKTAADKAKKYKKRKTVKTKSDYVGPQTSQVGDIGGVGANKESTVWPEDDEFNNKYTDYDETRKNRDIPRPPAIEKAKYAQKRRMPLEEGLRISEELEKDLRNAGFDEVEVVGSIRRREEDVGDIDVIVHGDMENIKKISSDITELGDKRATFTYGGDTQVNLWYSPLETWGAAVFAYTGPRGYVIGYRKRAKEQGLLLNEEGLFDKSGNLVAGATEEEIYQALNKEWKPPEERG
jgi:hypothetical protein